MKLLAQDKVIILLEDTKGNLAIQIDGLQDIFYLDGKKNNKIGIRHVFDNEEHKTSLRILPNGRGLIKTEKTEIEIPNKIMNFIYKKL